MSVQNETNKYNTIVDTVHKVAESFEEFSRYDHNPK